MFRNKRYIFFIYLSGFVLLGLVSFGGIALPKNHSVYRLSIDYQTINVTGKDVQAMVVNRLLPAPTLYFREGQKAVIDVTNQMDVESSIHWHGILLPNFQDGVPYLTTPPILPGKTHRFEFKLKQAGTYWYHSHTGLQEQRGVYGAIVIEPRRKKYRYDHDLVLVLSDWTDEDPHEVLRTLKRGNDWYGIRKGSALSLMQAIGENALWSLFKMWSQRMPGVDISDVYYPAFLVNGKQVADYNFKPGEKIRLRVVNASASTYFWLSFGGPTPLLISADGQNVRPVRVRKLLHAIAETYDFLVTIPRHKKIEVRATAQDTSGFALATLGEGEVLKAPPIPKVNWVQKMKDMAHKHGSGSHQKHVESHKHVHSHKLVELHKEHHAKNPVKILKSLKRSSFSKRNILREVHFNLTGNMYRYVWSLDNRVLSEADKIQVKRGETLRLHLHNQTMMHHPMHLHGHFFRVLNQHGVYSPLKHTVDVPPMETVVIEFQPEERGDWFFHCHVLYHMKSGMARIFSNESYGDIRLNPSKILNADRDRYVWMDVGVMGYQGGDLVSSIDMVGTSTRHQFNSNSVIYAEELFLHVFSSMQSSMQSGMQADQYRKHIKLEGDVSYEYFVDDFFRLFVGGEWELKEVENSKPSSEIDAWMGIRSTLPFFVEVELGVNYLAQLSMGIEYEVLLFSRAEFFVGGEWRGPSLQDLNDSEVSWGAFKEVIDLGEYEGFLGFRYIVNKSLALLFELHSDFGYGAGVNWQI